MLQDGLWILQDGLLDSALFVNIATWFLGFARSLFLNLVDAYLYYLSLLSTTTTSILLRRTHPDFRFKRAMMAMPAARYKTEASPRRASRAEQAQTIGWTSTLVLKWKHGLTRKRRVSSAPKSSTLEPYRRHTLVGHLSMQGKCNASHTLLGRCHRFLSGSLHLFPDLHVLYDLWICIQFEIVFWPTC